MILSIKYLLFYLQTTKMVNTKTTKHTGAKRCPMCSQICSSEDAFKEHVVICAMTEHTCDICDYKSNRIANVKRHRQRAHKGMIPPVVPLGRKEDSVQAASTSSKADESDWNDQDPGTLIAENEGSSSDSSDSSDDETGDPDELMVGRIIRKASTPEPVFSGRVVIKRASEDSVSAASKKIKLTEDAAQIAVEDQDVSKGVLSISPDSDTHSSSCQSSQTNDVATQHEVTTRDIGVQCEKYRKRSKEVKVTKYNEGGKTIEIVHEVEEFFNM